MKKIFGVFVMSVLVCGFIACSNSQQSSKYQNVKVATERINEITPALFIDCVVKSAVFNENDKLLTIEIRGVNDSHFFKEKKDSSFNYLISLILVFQDIINTGGHLKADDGDPELYVALGDLLKEIEKVGGISLAFDMFGRDYTWNETYVFSAEATENAIKNWKKNNPLAMEKGNIPNINDVSEYTIIETDTIAIDTLEVDSCVDAEALE